MNTSNLVIMGHSAGGGLAAALALLARDRGLRTIAGLVLIYPMLDHRTGTPDAPPANPTTGTFSWSRQANHFAGNACAVPTQWTMIARPCSPLHWPPT